jgi:hypothetical protein
MSNTIRVALPGYDALTDTDPDHFALYTDEDWVLIKEKSRSTVSVGANSTKTVAHGLSYVPLVFAFAETSSGVWKRIDGDSFDGNYVLSVDNTNVNLTNNTAGAKNFSYYIFYDGVTSGTPSITESEMVLKVAKDGIDAQTSKNPNDFIFHSDLNTFKMVKTGIKSVTLLASTDNQSFTQAHGLSFIPLVHAFAKEEDRTQIIAPNSVGVITWGALAGIVDTGTRFNYIQSDATNITFNFNRTPASNKDVDIRYYCLEKI